MQGFFFPGMLDVGIACGVEAMSRVGLGANVIHGPGYFQPADWPWDTAPDQFTYVERIAKARAQPRLSFAPRDGQDEGQDGGQMKMEE